RLRPRENACRCAVCWWLEFGWITGNLCDLSKGYLSAFGSCQWGASDCCSRGRDGPHRLSLRHAGQQHAGRFEKITAFCRELARCLWPCYGRQGPVFGTAITMGVRVVTVFGGTGFLGRRVV